ncbi:hypothetical protein Q4511_14140 [Paracoccus sp. 1_MG-2023]|uniref:hypothetical protein n=1 Tax=unclassified Paracoccus (in: a-proteobacteria) TaxID=2688777 RepID=UPI001C08AF61|nr:MULTISPECIES: hypothetical protein [unclassified Paracoccus (in: a-proteobacteria)]MBU2959196.1 hypothetical protein [Paracoccus sp. C2R09]MDO6670067.1 hypothetical protein [Paracoccus sp. 1_MG-2023]
MTIRKLTAIAALSALTAFPAFATVQGANGPRFADEAPAQSLLHREVRAGDILQQKDLKRAELSAQDRISVSEVPANSDPVDFSSANNG